MCIIIGGRGSWLASRVVSPLISSESVTKGWQQHFSKILNCRLDAQVDEEEMEDGEYADCANWSLHISHLAAHTNSPSVPTDHYTFLTSQFTPTHPLWQLITTHISPRSSHQLTFCADWSLHISHLTVHTNSTSVPTDHYTFLTSQLTPTHPLCQLITTHISPSSSHQLAFCANWSLHISYLTVHTNSTSVPTDHYTFLT